MGNQRQNGESDGESLDAYCERVKDDIAELLNSYEGISDTAVRVNRAEESVRGLVVEVCISDTGSARTQPTITSVKAVLEHNHFTDIAEVIDRNAETETEA